MVWLGFFGLFSCLAGEGKSGLVGGFGWLAANCRGGDMPWPRFSGTLQGGRVSLCRLLLRWQGFDREGLTGDARRLESCPSRVVNLLKDVKGWAATKAEFRKGTGVSRLSDGKGKIGEASEIGGGNMGREG